MCVYLYMHILSYIFFLLVLGEKLPQKQPSRGILEKRCSKIMQQIYRKTPMPKCDFNKVAKQLL